MRSSPNKARINAASSHTSLALFEDDDNDGSDNGVGALNEQSDDEVTIEVERWKSISQDTLTPFKDKDTKMINEFAFMWAKVGAMAASNRIHSVH